MRKLFLLLVIAVIYGSCIPNKDLIYFQGEPLPKDSIYKLQNEPYRLQVNDILFIHVKSADDELVKLFRTSESTNTSGNVGNSMIYYKGYDVDTHGNIRLPYIGEVNVLGYTTDEVRKKLQKEFEIFFKNKEDIFITVKLAGVKLTVLGEVRNPGSDYIFQNQVTIAEAIANAGDILVTGNRKKVTVLRKTIDETKKYTIDLTDIAALESENFFVQSNDIIYVEPLKQKSWGTGTTGMQTITTAITVLSLVTTTILLINSFK